MRDKRAVLAVFSGRPVGSAGVLFCIKCRVIGGGFFFRRGLR